MVQQISRKDFMKRKAKTTDKDAIMISVKKEDKHAKSLLSRGVQKQTFSIPEFNLEESITSFTSEVKDLKPIKMQRKEQLDTLKPILKNPFYAPYILCLSGKPNDLKAKLLATYIMSRAMEMQLNKTNLSEKTQKYLSDKSFPIFTNVMGWTANALLEQREKPSLIVFSNVPQGMTMYKQEKLRDMLEMYSGTPRIVVTANHDPITFFNGSLFMHLNACCFLTNGQVKKSFEV